MRFNLLTFFPCVLICSCSDNSTTGDNKSKPVSQTFVQENIIAKDDTVKSFDMPTIQGKAKQLIQQLKDSGDFGANNGLDTLVDMNGDNQLDVLIEFYYGSGTGLKNGTEIFLFDKAKNQFIEYNPITLPNPTFDFNNKTVVSYYIAFGGGTAWKLRWNVLQLDTLEKISVDIKHKDADKIKVESTLRNYVTGKVTKTISDSIGLPVEYHYYEYKPIIKRE